MKIDWGRVTHFFQIPLAWFREVDRRSWIVGDGKRLQVQRDAEGTKLSFDDRGLGASRDTGTPSDQRDTSPDDDQRGSTWTWASGGTNGLIIDCYGYMQKEDNWHYPQRITLTFSKDGLLISAVRQAGRKEIQG